MPPYPIPCDGPGCGEPAQFKVAAAWSDGPTRELKTYALCCPACLPAARASAASRHARCRLVPGETLDPPAVFELARGKPLARRADLE